MKLIIGLGNPGRKYQGTRHNVGYMTLAELAKRFGVGRPKGKFQGEVLDADLTGQRALLLSPTTYMNNSGMSVQAAKEFYKLSLDELLVISDDLNLPLGKVRIRSEGSAGGQKGLADIVRRLGTESFPRLRIGIGSPPEDWDAADYVLSTFTREELPEIEKAIVRAVDAVVDWAHKGIQYSMNQYN